MWSLGGDCVMRVGPCLLHQRRTQPAGGVGGALSSPRICQHLDPGLPASTAVRSTFCCFQASQFMVLLLSQPKQTETVVLFLCIRYGVPPNTHAHTCVCAHTHLCPSGAGIQHRSRPEGQSRTRDSLPRASLHPW